MAGRTMWSRIRASKSNGSTPRVGAKRGGDGETATGDLLTDRDPDQKPERGRRHRALSTFAVVVLALATGGVVAACSSGTSTSGSTATSTTSASTTSTTSSALRTACKTANTQFDAFLTVQNAAADAAKTANNAWIDYSNSSGSQMPDPSSSALNTAINQFNTDNATAAAARQTANQDLAQYQATLAMCKQAGVPQACQSNFADHETLLDAANRLNTAHDAEIPLIVAEQQADRAGDANAYNAQIDQINAAADSANAAKAAWSSTLASHAVTSQPCESALGIVTG